MEITTTGQVKLIHVKKWSLFKLSQRVNTVNLVRTGGCITLPDTGHSLTKPHCKTILLAFQPNVTLACIGDSSLTRPHDFKTEKAKYKSSHQKSPITALAVTQKRRITSLIIEQSGNVGMGGWVPARRAED